MTVQHIVEVFEQCHEQKRAAFIPYLCGGDPDLETTRLLLRALAESGADIIEVGVPFSDPIADGPVNQRAAFRALESGTTLSSLLALIGEERARLDTPIVLFSYYNPIFAMGLERFATEAAEVGVDGVLCVDLPPEEAEEAYIPALGRMDIAPIFLLAPTSSKDRVRLVGNASKGFAYYVSRLGVTGKKTDTGGDLGSEVKAVRRRCDVPVAVGFGISTPEQVCQVAEFADGVVVGSALVQLVEDSIANGLDGEAAAEVLGARVKELSADLSRKKILGIF